MLHIQIGELESRIQSGSKKKEGFAMRRATDALKMDYIRQAVNGTIEVPRLVNRFTRI